MRLNACLGCVPKRSLPSSDDVGGAVERRAARAPVPCEMPESACPSPPLQPTPSPPSVPAAKVPKQPGPAPCSTAPKRTAPTKAQGATATHWPMQKLNVLPGFADELKSAKIRHFTEHELQTRFAVTFANGRLFLKHKKRLYPAGKDCLDFIVDTAGQMFAGPCRPDTRHTSYSGGAPVLAAGELTISGGGRIVEVTNKSGHYRPSDNNLRWFRDYLSQRGIRLGKLTAYLEPYNLRGVLLAEKCRLHRARAIEQPMQQAEKTAIQKLLHRMPQEELRQRYEHCIRFDRNAAAHYPNFSRLTHLGVALYLVEANLF